VTSCQLLLLPQDGEHEGDANAFYSESMSIETAWNGDVYLPVNIEGFVTFIIVPDIKPLAHFNSLALLSLFGSTLAG
jgi:hypothetical protein